MIKELIETKCIQSGNFQLKNGQMSKYYYNMKKLISFPDLLKKIGDQIYKELGEFDIICGIPYGGLPIASYISTTYNKPMIIVRENEKKYGTKEQIEGNYNINSRCVIIDDVITSGKSIQNVIEILKDKVTIVKCYAIFDRQQNYECSMKVECLYCKNDVVKYRLDKIKKEKNSDLCFSADLSDYSRLWNIIEEIGEKIVCCKIHFDTIEEEYRDTFKKKIIELSINHDFLIMEDRKFNDISHIVKKQYKLFETWVDLVTVHTNVSSEVVQSLCGVLLVANMSNNDYDFSPKAESLALENRKNVVGFITQKRLHKEFICMTPGISITTDKIGDQNYRKADEIDTDFKIIGRAIYNNPSNNLKEDIKKILN